MLPPSPSISKALTCVAVASGVFAIGVIDHVTGADIHVQSLYLVPLAFAGWQLGRTGAAFTSLLSTLVWLGALYTIGSRYSQAYIWLANFLTQGAAFLTVSFLVAVLGEALRKEQSLSRTDSLTGLKNRQAPIEQASLTLLLCRRYARPVSLAYIDLDNFKTVNDSLGHARGDDLLRECGGSSIACLRASDIAARLGGDEFVVFLPETSGDSAVTLMERVRNFLETSVDFRAVGVTASIGVVFNEKAAFDIDELLKHADAQMYQAKRRSKNRVELHVLAASE